MDRIRLGVVGLGHMAQRHFQGMKERYCKTFGNSYMVPSPNRTPLMQLFTEFCRQHGIMCRPEECFDYLNSFPEKTRQLSFLG